MMDTKVHEGRVEESTVVFLGKDRERGDALADWVVGSGFSITVSSSPVEFFSALGRIESGVVLLDGSFPTFLEIVERINAVPASPPVIVLSETVEFNAVVRAFRGGAVDVLQLPVERGYFLDRLLRAVRVDVQRARQRSLYKRLRRLIGSLTPREREVMHFVVEGSANKQIAADLGISEKTVEVHRHKVMRKMEADSLAELVRMNVIMEATGSALSMRA